MLNLLNEVTQRIIGVPFTSEPCILEVIHELKRSRSEEEALRLEAKIFFKQVNCLKKVLEKGG